MGQMTDEELLLYRRAMNKLSCGDLTPQGLYFRLIEGRKDVDHNAAKAVVRLLHAEGFLNEKRSFEALLSEGENKHWGKRKLKEELMRRRFGEKYRLLLEEADTDYYERARAFVRTQRVSLPATEKERASVYRKLLARGFSSEEASYGLDALGEEE